MIHTVLYPTRRRALLDINITFVDVVTGTGPSGTLTWRDHILYIGVKAILEIRHYRSDKVKAIQDFKSEEKTEEFF